MTTEEARAAWVLDIDRAERAVTDRLTQIEGRLSGDVWMAALSKKLRRLMAIGAIVAAVAMAGSVTALAQDVYVNHAIQRDSARHAGQVGKALDHAVKEGAADELNHAELVRIERMFKQLHRGNAKAPKARRP